MCYPVDGVGGLDELQARAAHPQPGESYTDDDMEQARHSPVNLHCTTTRLLIRNKSIYGILRELTSSVVWGDISMFQELIPEFVPPLHTSITIDPVYASHQWI